MKKALAAVLVLAVAIGVAAFAYYAAARERDYRQELGRGDQALHDGQTYGAIEAYSGAIALRPDSMLAHLRRGEAYQQRNELDAAARDFRTAAALDPTATPPLEALGDVMYQRGRYGEAASAYEAFLRLDDQAARVTYKVALARYRDGALGSALEAIDRTLRLNDRLPDAIYLQGVCFRELHRSADAIAAFEKAVTLSPGLIAAREELAELYRDAGRRTDEIEQLQILAGLDRTHVERRIAVGLAQAHAGRGELAVLTLATALERTPDQPSIYAALGHVWLDMAVARPDERPDALQKAIEALERVASPATASSDILTLYGRALLRADRAETAEFILQQAVRRFPVDPAAFLAYAIAAERQGHLDAARQALIEHVTLVADDPDFDSRAENIGRLSIRLGDVATALAWYQRAAAASPRNVHLLTAYAEALIKAGRLEAARAAVTAGLEEDPVHAGLLELQRRLAR
jgi:tetratricopeptide (TPR) repeat protein